LKKHAADELLVSGVGNSKKVPTTKPLASPSHQLLRSSGHPICSSKSNRRQIRPDRFFRHL